MGNRVRKMSLSKDAQLSNRMRIRLNDRYLLLFVGDLVDGGPYRSSLIGFGGCSEEIMGDEDITVDRMPICKLEKKLPPFLESNGDNP